MPAKRTYASCTLLAAIKDKALSNDAATSAATFLKELQPNNTNHLRAQFSSMQETKAPVKKLEAAQKEEAEADNKPAAALPVGPTKVSPMEDSVSLLGGKHKAVAARVAKPTPSLIRLLLRPRQKGRRRRSRSQRRPHPQQEGGQPCARSFLTMVEYSPHLPAGGASFH